MQNNHGEDNGKHTQTHPVQRSQPRGRNAGVAGGQAGGSPQAKSTLRALLGGARWTQSGGLSPGVCAQGLLRLWSLDSPGPAPLPRETVFLGRDVQTALNIHNNHKSCPRADPVSLHPGCALHPPTH